MKKLFRLLIRVFLFVLLIVVGIVLFNNFNFSSRQIKVEPVTAIPVPEKAADRLAGMVKIPTVSYESHIDTSAFIRFNRYLKSVFPLADSLLDHLTVNEYSHVYYWPGRNQQLDPILMLAHIDVVPVEGSAQKTWSAPPYSAQVKEGYMYGRGTLDDKVNIAAQLEAIEMLLKENYRPERGIYLAYGHDEEVGGYQGAQAIARRLEQQGLRFAYVLDEGSVIVEKALPGLEKPLAIIGYAEKGQVTLQLKVQLDEGGHASMPPAETAIGILGTALHRLQAQPFPAYADGPISGLLDFAGPEMVQPYKALFANRWLTGGLLARQMSADPGANAMLRTTTSPTILKSGVKNNVLPTEAEAQVNFRILPGDNIDGVVAYVKEVIDDERVRVFINEAGTVANPSAVSDTDGFGFRIIQKTTAEVFPDAIISPGLVVAGTDSRHYEPLSDHIYRFFPIQLSRADLKGIHGIDERIQLDAYKDVIRFYHRLILNSCK